MAITAFKCTDTESLFKGARVKRFVNIEAVAMRKLAMLNRAGKLDDLRVPPGNRLGAMKCPAPRGGVSDLSNPDTLAASGGELDPKRLKGNLSGLHSIRDNDQFRVCFRWTPEGPADVEIVDYH